MSGGLSHCGQAARRADPDRFYAALFAPSEKREALFALLAFNAEVARTREAVSEPPIGLIRLAWWREALDEIEAGRPPRAHPVVEALAEAFRRSPFHLPHLSGLIEAREADLDPRPFTDEAALLSYVNKTSGWLQIAMAETLGLHNEDLKSVGRAGIAWALTGLARSIAAGALDPAWATPLDAAARTGHDTVRRLMDLSAQERTAAGRRFGRLELPAVLPAALLPLYWRALRRTPYREPWVPGRIARLLLAAARGRA